MHGGSGRVDGGVGITLDDPGILIEVRQSAVLEVQGCDSGTQERIMDTARQVLKGVHAGSNVSITVRNYYPSHVGLGSGSQLMLAIARGIAEIYGRSLPVKSLPFWSVAGAPPALELPRLNTGDLLLTEGTHSDKAVKNPNSDRQQLHGV